MTRQSAPVRPCGGLIQPRDGGHERHQSSYWPNSNPHQLLILTFSFAALSLICFFVLSIMVGFAELKTVSLRSLENEARTIRERITISLERFEKEVRFLGRSPFLLDFIQKTGTPGEARARRRAEPHLALLGRINPEYHQLRFIASSGREQLRIENRRGQAVVTPALKLQDNSERYYFQETMLPAPGEVYLSPMDFNVE